MRSKLPVDLLTDVQKKHVAFICSNPAIATAGAQFERELLLFEKMSLTAKIPSLIEDCHQISCEFRPPSLASLVVSEEHSLSLPALNDMSRYERCLHSSCV